MKNSRRQTCSLEIRRESRTRNTLVSLSLPQPCDPEPLSPTGWSRPETGARPMHSKGQETDAERMRELMQKKKKKKGKKLTSSRIYAYWQGLLWDLHEINRTSTQQSNWHIMAPQICFFFPSLFSFPFLANQNLLSRNWFIYCINCFKMDFHKDETNSMHFECFRC